MKEELRNIDIPGVPECMKETYFELVKKQLKVNCYSRLYGGWSCPLCSGSYRFGYQDLDLLAIHIIKEHIN